MEADKGTTRRQLAQGALGLGAALAMRKPARANNVTVRMAIAPTSLTFLPIYWAMQKGYFAEAALTPDVISFSGSPAATAALLSGSIDMMTAGTVSLVKVGARNRNLVGIASIQALPTVAVVMRRDLADKFGRRPKVSDLKGMRIGTPPKGGFADMAMQYILMDAGLSPEKDVILLQFNTFPAIIKAGEIGQLEAALLIEPFQHVAVSLTKKWSYVLDVTHGEGPALLQQVSYTALTTTRSYLSSNREVAEKIVRIITRGAQACNDLNNKEEMIKVSMRAVANLDPKVVDDSVTAQIGTFSSKLTNLHIEKTIELLQKTGNMSENPSYGSLVDSAFEPLWS